MTRARSPDETFRAIADRPVDLVLFSGQTALPTIIAEGSAGVLALLVVAKGLAYALSLGAGFRGGPVFPAIAIGVAAALVGADLLPGFETTPAVAAGIAAGTAAVLRVPFTAVGFRYDLNSGRWIGPDNGNGFAR